jgi:hypothetical protein
VAKDLHKMGKGDQATKFEDLVSKVYCTGRFGALIPLFFCKLSRHLDEGNFIVHI